MASITINGLSKTFTGNRKALDDVSEETKLADMNRKLIELNNQSAAAK